MPASRSSSVGPEGCFSFFLPKVKGQRNNILKESLINRITPFLIYGEGLGMSSFQLWKVYWWSGPDFVRDKARFGDQVGQGQGQELDNNMPTNPGIYFYIFDIRNCKLLKILRKIVKPKVQIQNLKSQNPIQGFGLWLTIKLLGLSTQPRRFWKMFSSNIWNLSIYLSRNWKSTTSWNRLYNLIFLLYHSRAWPYSGLNLVLFLFNVRYRPLCPCSTYHSFHHKHHETSIVSAQFLLNKH